MIRFPLQVVAKSRIPEEHRKYYRYVRWATGKSEYGELVPIYYGWRSRWLHTFMDLVPSLVWRHLPVRWQTAHLFGDLE